MVDILGIICADEKEFSALDDKILTGLRKELGTVAERWASIIIHPKDGRIAQYITDKAIKYLSDDELKRVEILSEDWFPKTE